MSQLSESLTEAGEQIVRAADQVITYLPNIVGAIVVLLVAWLGARLLRFLSVRALWLFNRSMERFLTRGALSSVRLSESLVQFCASVIFLLVFVFGLEAASRVLRVDVVTQWIDRIIAYIPTILAGVAILIIGVLASRIVRTFVSSGLGFVGRFQSAQVGRFAQVLTIVVATIVALDQIEIEVRFPMTLIIVVAGAVLGGLSLAFGLGARDFAANLIAAQQASRQFEPGQQVTLHGISGVIVEITSTMIVVDTRATRVLIPARKFLEEASSIQEGDA